MFPFPLIYFAFAWNLIGSPAGAEPPAGAQPMSDAVPPKAKRGPPPGSRNKPRPPRAPGAPLLGRPLGSKNTKLSKARYLDALIAARLDPLIGKKVRATWVKGQGPLKGRGPPGTFDGRVIKQKSPNTFDARFDDGRIVKLTRDEVTMYGAEAEEWNKVESIHAASPPGAAEVVLPFTYNANEVLMYMIKSAGYEGYSVLGMECIGEIDQKWKESFGVVYSSADSNVELKENWQGSMQVSLIRVNPQSMPTDGSPAATHIVRIISLENLEAMMQKPGNDHGKGVALCSRNAVKAALDMFHAKGMY